MISKCKYVGIEGFWLEDTLGLCPMIVVESIKEIPIRYRCGDVNHDWVIDVTDAILIRDYVFMGAVDALYLEQADSDCDGNRNISDAVHIIDYMFSGGFPPSDLNRSGIPDC